MSEEKFEALTNDGDVISFRSADCLSSLDVSHPMLKLGEFMNKISQKLVKGVTHQGRDSFNYIWLKDGMNCEVMNVGQGMWRTGKLRIKLVVEFCPDEPNPSKSNSTNSPLDDLR